MPKPPTSSPISRAIRLAIEAASLETARQAATAQRQKAMATLLGIRLAECRRAARRELAKIEPETEGES